LAKEHSALHCSSLTSHQLGMAQTSQAPTACYDIINISSNKIGEPELCVRHMKQVTALREGDIILYPQGLLPV